MEKELVNLWLKFNKFTGIAEITNLGFWYCAADKNRIYNVLITGLNPSLQIDGKKFDNCSFEQLENRYFTKIKKPIIEAELQEETTYLDLFCFKESTQKTVFSEFLKTETNIDFIANHLAITQNEIERINPKVIVIKNRGSYCFWGKEVIQKSDKLFNVWMGYKFEKIKTLACGEVCYITGLIDSKERINQNIKETNLIGTIVLFSTYDSWNRPQPTKDDYIELMKLAEEKKMEYLNN